MIRGKKNPNARRRCAECGGFMRWGGENLADGSISLDTKLERARPPLDDVCTLCAPLEAKRRIAQLNLPLPIVYTIVDSRR